MQQPDQLPSGGSVSDEGTRENTRETGGDRAMEQDVQCARCGSSMDWTDCGSCDHGTVTLDDDDGYERDETCDVCDGAGGWETCLSSYEWCEANPLPGREAVARSTPEVFEVPL